MCNSVVFEDPFLIVYSPDKYITQKMCGEAVDDSLATLKLVPDWFVTSKMIKKLFTALYADENILYFNEDSGYPGTIILIRLLAWHITFEKRKELKKYK